MCFRSYVGFVWVPPLFDRVAVAVLLTGFSNVQDDSTMRMGGGGDWVFKMGDAEARGRTEPAWGRHACSRSVATFRD